MSEQKAQPMTKEEVMMLLDLVETNPVLFSKTTNASNNQLKEATWSKVTKSFNAMIASNPRKPEQLRLKWENLKKTAWKRSSKIRINNLKTEGGKPDFIPPNETLDKVTSILGPTCDDYSVPFEGDAVVEVPDDLVLAEELVGEHLIAIPYDSDPLPPAPVQPPISPMSTPLAPKKIFFSSARSKGKLNCEAAANDVKTSVIVRNRAITEYFKEKKKIVTLQKRKLELEILLLEKKTLS